MDYNFLSKTMLFRGISPSEIENMMGCLRAAAKKYSRGSIIFHAGESVALIGLILSGSVSMERDDVWGNRSILDKVGSGHIFAENYACLPGEPLMVNIVAAEDSEILFMSTDCMLSPCPHACGFHNRLIRNLLNISAHKALNLSRRILHTSSKTIRGRLLSYLSWQAAREGVREFDIPFNRQQLADYLGVDRSALSAELSKMQKEGLISYERSHFVIMKMDMSH